MDILIATLPGLIFTYLLTSWAIFMVLVRYLNIQDEQLPRYFFLTLGSGPLVLALFMWALYAFFSGQADWVYICAILTLFSLLSLMGGRAGWFAAPRLWQVSQRYFSQFNWRANLPGIILIVGTLFFLITQTTCSVLTPIYGSDQSQYALVSSLGYERKNFDFYPLRDYDPGTGYFDLSDHPPTFYMLKIWHYTLQGTSKFAGISKFIEPMYLIYLILIIGFVLLPYGFLATGIGMALVALVPGFATAVEYHAIDTFRLVPFLLCLLWLREALATPSRRMLSVAGFFTGLSMAPHSIGGLLSLPYFASLYLFLSNRKLWQRVLDLALVGIVALLVGGWGYVLNLLHSGSPVAAALPLFDQIKAIDYYTIRLFSMGIHDYPGMLWLGVLKQFSEVQYFGYAAWLALMAPLLCFKRLRQDPLLLISIFGCLGFFLLMLLASFFPQKRYIIFVMNPRYPLTVQPFLIILGAVGVTTLLQMLSRLFQPRIPFLKFGFVWTVTLLLCFQMLHAGKLMTKSIRHGHSTFLNNAVDWQATHLHETSYQFIERHIPKEKLFLAQSDAMFAYNLRRQVIGDIYPKMLDFYNASSVPEAVKLLHKMKVDYLLMHTGWWPSVVANTHMQHIVSDPALTDLVFQGEKSFIFSLLPKPRAIHIMSRMAPTLSQLAFQQNGIKDPILFDSTTMQLTLPNNGHSVMWEVQLPEVKESPQYRYRLTGQIQGSGQLRIFIKWGDRKGANNLLWCSTSAKPDLRPFKAQFILPTGLQRVRFIFRSELTTQPLVLKNIQLVKINVESVKL